MISIFTVDRKLPLDGRIYVLTIGSVLTTNVSQINLCHLLFRATLKVRLDMFVTKLGIDNFDSMNISELVYGKVSSTSGCKHYDWCLTGGLINGWSPLPDILRILVKAQLSFQRTFNGFSDVFCIDEEKVICYQLELLRYTDTYFDTEWRDVLSLLLSSVDIHAAFSLSASTHPSLATWNLEEGVWYHLYSDFFQWVTFEPSAGGLMKSSRQSKLSLPWQCTCIAKFWDMLPLFFEQSLDDIPHFFRSSLGLVLPIRGICHLFNLGWRL